MQDYFLYILSKLKITNTGPAFLQDIQSLNKNTSMVRDLKTLLKWPKYKKVLLR